MNSPARFRLRHAFALIAAVVGAACVADSPLGATLDASSDASLTPVSVGADFRAPALGTCTNLRAPAGSVLAFRAFAEGVQIHRWNGASWTFIAPSADLFADADGRGRVGTHYAGPSWETVSGSKITGAVLDRCPVSPNDIPWLVLKVTSDSGAGVLHGTTHIQRVNTVGGVAPASAGSFVGEERRVPYTAEYYFYRAP